MSITINSKTPKEITIGGKAVKSLSINGDVVWSSVTKSYLYFEDRSGAANTITCTKTGSDTEWLSLEYSTDKSTWSAYDLTQTLTIPANGKVYLRGSNTYGFGKDNSNYHTFTCSGNYALGGDLSSIMDDSLDLYNSRFGSRTFNGSTTLVDISQLVFGNKQILGTTFTWMFQNCSALTSLPNEIGLSYSPNIDFATHTSHFTQMFQNSPIANFPTFPNITAISKNGMYRIAQATVGTPNTNLTYVDLSNITTLYEGALYQAFHHITSLEVVKIDISAWPDLVDSSASDYNATYQWLNDVHSTGVFCTNGNLPIERGVSQIPQNWSIADLNGKLHAPHIWQDSNGYINIEDVESGTSCQFYYTTDNSTPTPSTGTLYTQEFRVADGTTIKAIAHYAGTRSDLITDSDVAEFVYVDCTNCDNWEECGYESYEDCDCQVNGNCPEEEDCSDCSNWEECGYESYEGCDCDVNGNCPE